MIDTVCVSEVWVGIYIMALEYLSTLYYKCFRRGFKSSLKIALESLKTGSVGKNLLRRSPIRRRVFFFEFEFEGVGLWSNFFLFFVF